MNTIVSSIHLEDSQKWETYAYKKVGKLGKFAQNIEEINVRLIGKKAHRGQDNDYYCEITIHIPKKVLEIVDSERSIDKAIDKAVERMKRKLVKYREKKISRWHKVGVLNKLLRR